MSSNPIVFEVRDGGKTKGTGLQASMIRSHAARVAHSRRRQTSVTVSGEYEKVFAFVPTPSTEFRSTHHPRSDKPSEQAEPDGEHNDESVANYYIPQPRSVLSADRSDPFAADDTQKLLIPAREGLEYAYHGLWPKYSPSVQGEALCHLITHWRKTAVQDPLNFHTQVANAMSMCYCLNSEPQLAPIFVQTRLKHAALAMKIIRENLQQLKGPASDYLLENILRMSSTGGNLFTGLIVRRKHETPLVEGLPIRLFSRFELGLPHFHILARLIQQRGGLECVSTSVQPAIFADIVTSAKLGTRPIFPIIREWRYFSDTVQHNFDSTALDFLGLTGHGFDVLHNDQSELKNLATRAAQLTAVVDQNHRGGAGHLPLHLICILTSVFEHDLNNQNTSEPPSPSESDISKVIANIVRLAMQIYSDFVLYPTLGAFDAKPRLSTELHLALTAYFMLENHNYNRFDRLVLWSLVMGACASEESRQRAWYFKKLSEMLTNHGNTWGAFLDTLRLFLWWDFLFEDLVRDIWEGAWGILSFDRSSFTSSHTSPMSDEHILQMTTNFLGRPNPQSNDRGQWSSTGLKH